MPRKISQAEAAENKKKQQVLRTAGYNIKVDGSWGPWQEKQYRKVTSAKRGKTSQANVGVMALPVAGYGIAQLLEGLGSMSLPSISLPSISASAAAMAAPVALTLAGPAYGLYETITGQHHQVNITPQERQAMTYAPDATRVSRPIVVSRTRVGSQSQSRPIGEMYINPALTRTRSVSMASEAPTDTDSSTEANTQNTGSSTEAPQTPNDNNEQNKRGWRDRVADKVSNAIRGKKKSTNPQTPQNPNSPGRVVRRVLWETKGNNFGSSYQWRNWAFRSPLYLGTLRTVGDGSIGKGAGKVVGYGLDQFGKFGAGFLEGINRSDSTKTNITTGDKLSPADSTRISLTKQYKELQKEQENKRLKAKIDSINSAGQNPQQISPEDSVRNAALKRYLDDIQHGKN